MRKRKILSEFERILLCSSTIRNKPIIFIHFRGMFHLFMSIQEPHDVIVKTHCNNVIYSTNELTIILNYATTIKIP